MANSHGAEEGCSPRLLDLESGEQTFFEKLANRSNPHLTVALSQGRVGITWPI